MQNPLIDRTPGAASKQRDGRIRCDISVIYRADTANPLCFGLPHFARFHEADIGEAFFGQAQVH